MDCAKVIGEPGRRQPARPMRALIKDLYAAVADGRTYLLAQADANFEEARHDMTFPRWAGFRARVEQQTGDIFARAVLAPICLDFAEIAADETDSTWQEIARREADYVAGARLRDRAGGWSYFPQLPELPPDLDSLAAALSLFSRAAPQHLPLCDEPIRLALAQQAPDGTLPTWILASTNTPTQHSVMQRGVERFWGAAIDVEVCARFFFALHAANPARFADAVHRGAEFIASQQQPSGLWSATWYWGDVYGTGLCLRLLRRLQTAETAVSRAVDAVCRSQRTDGGWGRWESVPLDTALALWVIMRNDISDQEEILFRACRILLEHQATDGSWPATPWIKMDVGRATSRISQTLTYQSRTITTAFVVRSLMLVGRHCERWD